MGTLLSFIVFSYQWAIKPIKKRKRELKRIQNMKESFFTQPSDTESELTSIYHSTNRALFQAKEKEEQYKKTLDDLAHSLKNHVIASKLLLQDLQSESTGKLFQQLTLMDDVIQGQLQRAALNIKELKPTTTVVSEPLQGLLSMFSKIYHEKNIEVYCLFNEEQELPIEKDDLMEILGNTLENSFRFAATKIIITIKQHNDDYILSIENDGPSIPEEQKESLFLRGVRADKLNAGTGLGLALCADIIEKYNGSIWFDTPDNKRLGALLKIKLPI
ncbi:ATP-binding protein [Aliivibrio fischeri]|uniref:ATP-binding protein n=1 Tax=Aliivibrio fischeri TaxID=668 RepID=UPI0018C752E4|nr:ATP-binding protein [Aliivibrio fischeri]